LIRVSEAVRLAEVIQVLVRQGFVDLVRRAGLHESIPAKLLRKVHIMEAPRGEPETTGRRLRQALTELGPTFIKFGQVLSTRPDLVGTDVARELSQLQDRITPIPISEMAPVFKEELGEDPSVLFDEFDPEPIAAASLSQVYRARLKTGEQVAVKIQRPRIERTIEADLSLMHRIAEWVATHVTDMDWFDGPGIVEEFARSIRRELDFHVEARVIERFRANFHDVRDVFVPKTYRDYSGQRVLTMDWVDGVRVDALDQYESRNCLPARVAAISAEMICRQIFDFHLFHADPHPGNIFITENDRIAFLDYGMIGHIERTDAMTLADLLACLFRADAAGFMDSLLLLTEGEPQNRAGMEHQVADFIAFEGQAIVGGGRVGEGIEKMINLLRSNQLQLAPRFSLLLKALATVETVGHMLDADMDMVPVIQPHVDKLLLARYSPAHLLADARDIVSGLMRLTRKLPADVEQVLRMLRLGKLKIQLNHEGLSHLSKVTDVASNRIAIGVILGSLIIGSSHLITVGGGAYRLGLAGYIVAGLLGMSLVISIIRSKKY